MTLLLVHCSNIPRFPKLVIFISIDQGTPSMINKYNHYLLVDTNGYLNMELNLRMHTMNMEPRPLLQAILHYLQVGIQEPMVF